METQEMNGHQQIINPAGMPIPVYIPEQAAEFCSPSINQLAVALAKAQGGFGVIERTREVTVRPRESAAYTFRYAPLDVVLAATLPSLNANGLALVSLPVCGGARLRTLLLHESGEWLAVELEMPKTEGPQKFGSALTYLRRYSAISLLGVASEEDDDGNAAEGNHIEKKTDHAPRAQQPKQEPAPPAGPWRAQGDDGTLILDEEVEDFDKLIKQLSWKPNFVGMFLQRRFGIPDAAVRRLTRQQFKVVAKLLTANGLGKEKYEVALKEAIEAGQVKP